MNFRVTDITIRVDSVMKDEKQKPRRRVFVCWLCNNFGHIEKYYRMDKKNRDRRNNERNFKNRRNDRRNHERNSRSNNEEQKNIMSEL